MKKNYPRNWQQVPWSEFPLSIEINGESLSLESFLNDCFDKAGRPTLPQEIHKEAILKFNWDYLNDPDKYMGKCISLGRYYKYPACCIFDFNFKSPQERHPAAMSYIEHCKNSAESNAWVLCDSCARYITRYGIETYLRNQAWEKIQPQRSKSPAKTEDRKNHK
jgi:hypothetical protein